MATKVKNNLGAIRSLNTLNKNARAAQKNLRKVSTGERINSAADDASAYGISERMREKIRSLNQANDNAQNDMAMMRTAEGAVANIVDILRTLKQKAIDSANDSNTDADRRIMQKEVDQLLDQIDDNALVTFNGKGLVNGQMSGVSRIIGAIWYCDGLYSSDLGDPNLTPRLTELKNVVRTSIRQANRSALRRATLTRLRTSLEAKLIRRVLPSTMLRSHRSHGAINFETTLFRDNCITVPRM